MSDAAGATPNVYYTGSYLYTFQATIRIILQKQHITVILFLTENYFEKLTYIITIYEIVFAAEHNEKQINQKSG